MLRIPRKHGSGQSWTTVVPGGFRKPRCLQVCVGRLALWPPYSHHPLPRAYSSYKRKIAELKDIKREIDHLQHLLEAAKVRRTPESAF